MRNISEFIMYVGRNWQVKKICKYEEPRVNTIEEKYPWHDAQSLLKPGKDYTGEDIILLHSTGFVGSIRYIISLEDYKAYVKSLKIPKGYRRATYKDIESGKKVCMRDRGDETPSYEYDHNFVGGSITNKESGPKYINIAYSPSNTHWVRLHDLCIKK